eukprot:scaffold129015_cov43-Prasinocladus_malaysianus.AAC.1
MGMGYDAQPVNTVEMLKCTEMLSAHAVIILSVAYAAYSPTLDTKEFREVLRASRLALTQKDMRRIMAEVDENADGTIDYDEFMPVMVELIQGIAAQQKAAMDIHGKEEHFKKFVRYDSKFEREEAAKKVAGLTPEELDYKLRE